MSLFQIDYKKFSALMLPTTLRKAGMLSVLRSLMQPMATLSDKRLSTRDTTLFELKHTGQVCYLRNALNTQFGLSRADGFEIADVTAEGNYLMAYDETDYLSERQLLIPDADEYEMLYDEDTIVETKQFTVFCPADIYNDTTSKMSDKMLVVHKIVDKYRLVSRMPEYKLKNT